MYLTRPVVIGSLLV